MSQPVLKIIDGPSPIQQGVSQTTAAGMGSALSAFSKAADLYPHDSDGLMQALHFKNQIAKAAARRSVWFGGRIYNRCTGEDPEYVPLSGTHLRQALTVAGIQPPDFIAGSGKYALRLDVSEKAVTALREKHGFDAG